MDTQEMIFSNLVKSSIAANDFIKLTLSKPADRNGALKNAYGRQIVIKGQPKMSFTLRFSTKDEVKNFSIEEGAEAIQNWLGNTFLEGHLFTLKGDHKILYNKKRKPSIIASAPSMPELPDTQHDHQKKRWIESDSNLYLHKLGITNDAGKILNNGQKKYRQINKYIEIVANLLDQVEIPTDARIADMGSGKGYLTFALYDYLKNMKNIAPHIVGVERRPDLVDFCNGLAKEAGFEGLEFVAKDITEFEETGLDMLIALHACDTATDIAIAKGIKNNAKVILVAPCCHKQISDEMHCNSNMQAIVKHGILHERQAEIITDGIRALLLEANGYQSKVFEFISNEHTSKNLMIAAIKSNKNSSALQEVEKIKAEYGIQKHYLETLL